jgi:hypothetical protein
MLRSFGNFSGRGTRTLLDVWHRYIDLASKSLRAKGVDLTREREQILHRRAQDRANRTSRYAPQETGTCMQYVRGGNLLLAYVRTLFADLDNNFRRVTPDDYEKFWTDETSYWGFLITGMLFALGRRLAVSENKHIGLASQRARVGDSICVLYGCSIPVLLRKDSDGRWTFVGDVYVHGLMNGEAVELMRKGTFSEEEWVIY